MHLMALALNLSYDSSYSRPSVSYIDPPDLTCIVVVRWTDSGRGDPHNGSAEVSEPAADSHH